MGSAADAVRVHACRTSQTKPERAIAGGSYARSAKCNQQEAHGSIGGSDGLHGAKGCKGLQGRSARAAVDGICGALQGPTSQSLLSIQPTSSPA